MLTTLSQISQTLPYGSDTSWFGNLAKLLKKLNPTSHDVTSTLVLLSAAVNSGSALPPYLRPPRYFHVSDSIMAADAGIQKDRSTSQFQMLTFARHSINDTYIRAGLLGLCCTPSRNNLGFGRPRVSDCTGKGAGRGS